MKLSQDAIKQMYPHLAGVDCEEHGKDQKRAKVPRQMMSAFESEWACGACLTDARESLAQFQINKRRAKEETQKAYRASLKEARQAAKIADSDLMAYVSKCKDSVGAVKLAEAELDRIRNKTTSARNKAEGAYQILTRAKAEYESYEADTMKLVEAGSDQFEALEKADSDVALCYNELRAKLDESNALWNELGKSARKKRDRASKKTAMLLLKERESARTDIRGCAEGAEEVQCTGEKELPERCSSDED
jgi:hypothetical protein